MPKRRIHKFNFEDNMKSGAKSHVSLVDSAANLQEVLVMKNQKEVTVELSMKNFLKKFFGMWEEDAATLAGIMGYSSEAYNEYEAEDGTYMSTQEYIESKVNSVTLLKSTKLDELESLPESIHSVVSDLQKQYEEAMNEASANTEDTPNEELSSDLNKTKEVSMDLTPEQIEDLQKQAKQAQDLQKQLDEAKSVLADIEKAKEAKAKEDMEEVVKGYSFVTEEEQEGLVATLLKSEDSAILLSTLEKAQDAIKASATQELGDEGEDAYKSTLTSDNDAVINAASNILKSRKAQ